MPSACRATNSAFHGGDCRNGTLWRFTGVAGFQIPIVASKRKCGAQGDDMGMVNICHYMMQEKSMHSGKERGSTRGEGSVSPRPANLKTLLTDINKFRG